MPKVSILGLDYEIERVPFITRDECTLGQIDFIEQKILILDSISKDKESETLLHEVIHGIFQGLGLSDENQKEAMVQSLAATLYHCMKQNREIFQGFFV